MKRFSREGIPPLGILLSFCVFMLGWAIKVFFLKTDGLGELASWGIGFLVYVIWWPCFAFFLIRRYNGALHISMKEMLCTLPELKILVPALAVALLYNLICKWTGGLGSGTHMPLYDLIVTILTVGFFEEIVFRGWFLNVIASYIGERAANIISAILFSLAHFPGWIKHGYGIDALAISGISIALVGLFFGYIFRKSRSIWTSAIVHSVWDMLTWIL